MTAKNKRQHPLLTRFVTVEEAVHKMASVAILDAQKYS